MQEVNEFGIGMITGDKPKVGVFEGKSKKFVMEDEFSVDAFEKFVKDYTDGKLQPYLKSEDVPESQGNVKVAVAKNFDDLIFNSGKDALIGRLFSLSSYPRLMRTACDIYDSGQRNLPYKQADLLSRLIFNRAVPIATN